MRILIGRFMVTWQWLNVNVVRWATIKQFFARSPTNQRLLKLFLPYVTKHLFTGPLEKSKFRFSSTSSREKSTFSEKQNELSLSGPVIKCILFYT